MKQNIVALDLSFSLDLHCHQQSISPLSSTTKNINEPPESPVEVDRPGSAKRLEMRDALAGYYKGWIHQNDPPTNS